MGEPPPRRSPTRTSLAGDTRTLRSTARRTWRFFETFVGPDDHAPAARQLPGGSEARRGAPHVAHEHRSLSALDGRRAGLRLARPPRDLLERLEATLATHGPPRAFPRPLLQLVRHARPAAAGAALRVDRGQREPRRPSPRARQRVRERAAPVAARRRGVRRHRRRARCSSGTPRARSAAAIAPRRSTLGQLDEAATRWRPRCARPREPGGLVGPPPAARRPCRHAASTSRAR